MRDCTVISINSINLVVDHTWRRWSTAVGTVAGSRWTDRRQVRSMRVEYDRTIIS